MYAVCKTPNCQQTYPVGELVESIPQGTAVFCKICNGEVVSKTGHARLSGNPHVITVVGHRLLNVLYKDGQIHSMKLKIEGNNILSWTKGDSYTPFFSKLKKEIRPFNPKIELTTDHIDSNIEITEDVKAILFKNGIQINRSILQLKEN